MKIQSYIHGHQGIGHLILDFQHQMRLMTQTRLSHATSSKITIDTISLLHRPMLLQCPSITQNRVFYREIWTMKTVGSQMLNTTRTAIKTYQEAYLHVEHDPQNKYIKSYRKTTSGMREKSARRSTRILQELLISSLLSNWSQIGQNGPFYILFIDYMDHADPHHYSSWGYH